MSIRLSHLCHGSPTVFPGIPDYEALEEAGSNDASYPLYCTATLPVCSNGQPVSCTCSGGGEAGAWACVY